MKLLVIVLAQFAGTSMWFAANAALAGMGESSIGQGSIGAVTSSVQLGFIVGTLVFALSNIADRWSPPLVFLICSLFGALANVSVTFGIEGLPALLALRFAVGFFLAGIYPVGMKIAASWYPDGLGRALGLLVAALVLGTAFPHLLRAGGGAIGWRAVMQIVSAAAALGGVMLFVLVPAGPHLPQSTAFDPRALRRVFASAKFRAAAFGYFGHMWELYALWAFVPLLVAKAAPDADHALWSFIIIAAGAVGCAAGGSVSLRHGSARVAAWQITASGALCVLCPFVVALPPWMALAIMVVWGAAVVGDSPQLSALNAAHAPRELVGTALTIVTCIGFAITIPAIQLVTWLVDEIGIAWSIVALAPGPALGRWSLRTLLR